METHKGTRFLSLTRNVVRQSSAVPDAIAIASRRHRGQFELERCSALSLHSVMEIIRCCPILSWAMSDFFVQTCHPAATWDDAARGGFSIEVVCGAGVP